MRAKTTKQPAERRRKTAKEMDGNGPGRHERGPERQEWRPWRMARRELASKSPR